MCVAISLFYVEQSRTQIVSSEAVDICLTTRSNLHVLICSDIHDLCVLLHILRAVLKALQMKQ